MRHPISLLLTLAASLFLPYIQCIAAQADIVAPGAKVEKLSDGFLFTEGPTANARGDVYFTDQPNDRILCWSIEGKLSTFMQPAGRSNGMMFDAEGRLIACADEKNELWSIAPDGKKTIILNDHDGRRLNGPNDVWVHPSGALYFTDPYYQRKWWKHKIPPQSVQGVYRLGPERTGPAKRVIDSLQQPNGIIGTPDGRTLYVADIKARNTWRYSIQPDGSLADGRVHCAMGSDGMTLDERGNVYLTGKTGVVVFAPDGSELKRIDVAEPWTANVSFGGADRKTLFITASRGLYAIRLNVRGANVNK